MTRILLLDVRDPEERRAALLEDGAPSLLWIERDDDRTLVGNVYLGRVVRVESSIDAAFVDLGLERPGFLPADDAALPEVHEDGPNGSAHDGAGAPNGNGSNGAGAAFRARPIAETVTPGDEIVVQVARDAVGRKGPTLTRQVAYPGRTLVLIPGAGRLAVSRKIAAPSERARLEARLRALGIPEGVGAVARTAAADATDDEMAREAASLLAALRAVEAARPGARAPSLLHAEAAFVARAVRELSVRAPEGAAGPVRIVVDGRPEDVDVARCAVAQMDPRPEVAAHATAVPLFHSFGVERAVRVLDEPRVALPGGASIVIHESEAMWTIDVNSGRLRTGDSLEATALATDLLAAVEVARQIRLRDLAGLVVVDFIDCREPANRAAVEETLRRELAKDPARMRIAPLSEFMVAEITRRRLRSGPARTGSEVCTVCDGRGRVQSAAAAGLAALRDVRALLAEGAPQGVVVVASRRVAAELDRRAPALAEIQSRLGGRVTVRIGDSLPGTRFDVRRA